MGLIFQSRLKIQKTDSAVTSSKAVGGRKTATFNVINDYEMRLLIQVSIKNFIWRLSFYSSGHHFVHLDRLSGSSPIITQDPRPNSLLQIIVWQFFDRCTSAALCEGRIFGKVLVDIPMRTHSMITGVGLHTSSFVNLFKNTTNQLPWMIFSGLSPILFLIMNKWALHFTVFGTAKNSENFEVVILVCIPESRRMN
jgi:hypothetical protein